MDTDGHRWKQGTGYYPVAAGVLLFLLPSAAQAQPHHSFDKMVSSNGHGAVTYDLATRRVDGFHEHIYKYPTSDVAGTQTRDFLYDTYFGIRVGTEATWLTEVPLDEAGYVEGTGIIRTVQTWRGLRIESFYFAPWELTRPGLAMIVRVTNTGGAESGAVSLFTIHNLHLGTGRPDPGFDSEWIGLSVTSEGLGFNEFGPSGASAAYWPITFPSRHACTPNNPYDVVRAGSDLVDTDGTTAVSDAVAGYQFDVGPIPAGANVSRGVVIVLSRAGGEVAPAAASFVRGRSAEELLADEAAAWTAWHAAVPSGLSADEAAVWSQSVAVLRMAQVREAGLGNGQIVASLPPGQWNISWVRDACYAIDALVRTGHFAEAREGLRFMLDADAGDYETEVGRPYRISVTRYFGNGTEESDWNADGPNIEFDGFGLFLGALWALADASDDAFWEPYWPAIRDEIADVLVALRDPSTGLIAPDSSIWEVHWNGRQKRYGYTSLAAACGLCAASRLAERMGDPAKAMEYRAAAFSVRDAILEHLLAPDLAIAQSREELTAGFGYRDAAVVEALNWGLVRPDGLVGRATLDGFFTVLRPPSGHGFFRNDDGGWYDNQEWVVIDLRVANALRLAGRTAEAAPLVEWVTGQSVLNQDLVAELYEATTSDYQGAAPMVGFGAGAYLLALADRAAGTVAEPLCGEWGTEPGADADADGDADGGGDADGDGADADAAAEADAAADTLDDADVGTDAGTGGGGADCSCSIPFPFLRPGAILGLLFVGALCALRGRRGR
ncbi:MAG: hypothetical protein HY905_00290 [Deltaproteobacteria bacterium]|nr:hypothetical protein [Deltaproteobacteria bacterium]